MDILFYSASLKGIGKRLLRIVVSHVSQNHIEVCRSIAALDARLHKPLDSLTIAVLHLGSQQELKELIARRDLFADFRTILVLPDGEERTVADGHRLRPRFVLFSDGDLPDASVVLGKIIQGCKNYAITARRGGGKDERRTLL